MSPQEALKLLEAVTSGIPLNRQQHIQIMQALDILAKSVKSE